MCSTIPPLPPLLSPGGPALHGGQRSGRLAHRHDLRAHPLRGPGAAGVCRAPGSGPLRLQPGGPPGLQARALAGGRRPGHPALRAHVPAPLPDWPRDAATQQVSRLFVDER